MELKGNQEAFDAMVAHMRAQKYVRAYSGGIGSATCRYRTPEGRKCVVGALICDTAYSKNLEGSPVFNSLVYQALCTSGWGGVASGLLEAMQDAHDDPVLCGIPDMDADGSRFEEAARQVAEDYDLTYTPPA